eukprot:GHVU01021478.1.p3 GENE.GHVU01021478.1~~GHVU01021478.1.p3  ORF type:complete len:111 (+),score=8.12 GHVU01021478.1:824-1156(+)
MIFDTEEPATAVRPMRDELEEYLSMSVSNPSLGFDGDSLLRFWWSEKEDKPSLTLFALEALGCPPASAAVERLFSVGTRTRTSLRRRQKDTTMQLHLELVANDRLIQFRK